MEKVRASDVATEGFQLIHSRPVAVLVWGLLVTLAQTVVPTILILWLMFSPGSELRIALASDRGLDPNALQALELKANLIQWGMLPFSIMVSTLVSAAILRSVLEPEKRSYFSLRVGPTEGWILLVSTVMMVLIGVVCLPVVVVIALAVVFVAMSSQTAALLVGIVLGVAALGGFVWLGARFILAIPLTFKARKFRLFESWALTRGHVWWIVRIWLVVMALVIAMIIGVMILGGVVIGIPMVITAAPLLRTMQDVDPAVWMAQNLGMLVGWGIGLGLIWVAVTAFWSGALLAISTTPAARVFQILVSQQPDTPMPATEAPSPDPAAA